MILPQPSCVTYGKITKRNAEEFFINCMLVKSSRIEWLIHLALTGGAEPEELDFSRQSLLYIWQHVHRFVHRVTPAPFRPDETGGKPEWFSYLYPLIAVREEDKYSIHKGGYDLRTLWIMDGLAYYFGEVFVRRYEHMAWRSFVSPRYEMSGIPHILSEQWPTFNICPWQQAAVAMVRTWAPGMVVDISDFVKAFDALCALAVNKK